MYRRLPGASGKGAVARMAVQIWRLAMVQRAIDSARLVSASTKKSDRRVEYPFFAELL
jgi:hypothetical protein